MRLSFKRGLFDKLHGMINRGKFNPFIRVKFSAKAANPLAPVEERVYCSVAQGYYDLRTDGVYFLIKIRQALLYLFPCRRTAPFAPAFNHVRDINVVSCHFKSARNDKQQQLAALA